MGRWEGGRGGRGAAAAGWSEARRTLARGADAFVHRAGARRGSKCSLGQARRSTMVRPPPLIHVHFSALVSSSGESSASGEKQLGSSSTEEGGGKGRLNTVPPAPQPVRRAPREGGSSYAGGGAASHSPPPGIPPLPNTLPPPTPIHARRSAGGALPSPRNPPPCPPSVKRPANSTAPLVRRRCRQRQRPPAGLRHKAPTAHTAQPARQTTAHQEECSPSRPTRSLNFTDFRGFLKRLR